MTERAGDSIETKTLNEQIEKTDENYPFRPDVERQIAEFSTFEDAKIFERLTIRGRDEAGFVLDETIVRLLRARRDDRFFVDTLYAELNRRIWKLLGKFYRKFDSQADFEDFGQTVEMAVIKNIFNADSETGKYAQVYFGDYVVKTATYAWYGKLRDDKKRKDFFETERAADEDESAERDENRFISTEVSTEEKMILRARLAELPENARNAAILHYLDGWQIESKDAHAPTICKLFKVSSRTIRNWLTEAREILAAQ